MASEEVRFTIPVFVTDYLKDAGYDIAFTEMKEHIEGWGSWLRSAGEFYDYRTKGDDGVLYEVHRLSVKPAKKVCKEWASLLMNEYTQVQCENEECNEWLADFYEDTNFWSNGQGLVMKAFGLGTGGWAPWLDLGEGKMLVRRYGVNMILPLSWDDDGITECAFCTSATVKGKKVTQLQLHLKGEGGYVIRTVIFDENGDTIEDEGSIGDLETGCPTPTFAIVRPAIENMIVEGSPYGVSVFEDAVDAIKAVDLAYDAIFSEVDVGKLRVFLSDLLIEETDAGEGGAKSIPFGKSDCTFFRKLAGNGDLIKEFAPSLRTEQQVKAYRTALQSLGDSTGFGLRYFDIDESGGIRTATEVSSDNSQLMRTIRMHENLLGDAIAQISRAVLHLARTYLDESLPESGTVTVNFDDSIIQDTAAEKAQDMAEVAAGLMQKWEFRVKWYGEEEAEAKRNAGVDVMDMGD